MIDYANIVVTAGKGGNGSSSRHQIKGKRYGRADGGDGGNGGNVFMEATNDLSNLEPYRFVKDYKAEDGTNGLGNLRRGATSPDLILKVPIGTNIKVTNVTTENEKDVSGKVRNEDKVAAPTIIQSLDLIKHGERVLIARCGRGGRGNSHLRDEHGYRPRMGETGQLGEQVALTLELKLFAQVGLIGLPNAGKSTLLAALTAAHPQIAAYPFTTLEPNLGVLVATKKTKKVVFADLPGLIEGAAEGRGLGHTFLRHIERTKVLIHIIDINSLDIWKDYQTIRNELKNFGHFLTRKKEIIVINKIDQATQEQVKDAVAIFAKNNLIALPISAQNKQGLEELVKKILDK